tara:strand:- start:317 stop:1030 length:714 start_codon:yes stop_codon:yes gene_type:complete
MVFKKYLIIVLFLFLNYGCNKEIVRENQPIKKDSGISKIVKSDIDDVLEVHVNKSRKLLKELMKKLYKRNPRELKKSPHKIAEENIVRLFDLKHSWDFPELQGTHDAESIQLVFSEEYDGDRVFAFVSGIMSMIMKSYNYKSKFYVTDSVDPQKLYNCARNIEIAIWKLSNDINSKGELFLRSNSLAEEKISNLSYERLFGKLIATQDNMAIIIADKKKRTIKTVIQKMATAIFIPI